jgi:genome maintenance exonuclease 1
MIDKLTAKYNYLKYNINYINNIKYYSLNQNISLPSVTSILRHINGKVNLNSFNPKITNSMEIGDLMHNYLEDYIHGRKNVYVDSKNFSLAKTLANIVIDNIIINFDEIWGSEVSVSYKNQYAGTIDLIGIFNKKLCIMDYKSSYKKKNMEELEDYFLQCAAYTIAHDWQFNTNVDSIMIFQVVRNGDFEKNIINKPELDLYKEKWFDKLEKFNAKIAKDND